MENKTKNDILATLLLMFIMLLAFIFKILIPLNSEEGKLNREINRQIQEKYKFLIYSHENKFEKIFELDNKKININNIDYKEILNYKDIINNNFTEIGKELYESQFRKVILRHNNKYYLKLDELNDNIKYLGSAYTKDKTETDSVKYKVNSKIEYLGKKNIYNNEVNLIHIDNNWLIEDFSIEIDK